MSLTAKIQQTLGMLFGGGVQLSNRNGFVDGAMAYWNQNVASPVALPANAGGFTGPIMWRAGAGTGGAGTIAIIDLRGSAADLAAMEGDDTYACFKMVITAGSSGTVAARTTGGFYQNIENVARYAGKSVTFSVKLKADAAITIPSILAAQAFGSGGSPSASVTLDKTVTWNVGTSFKKFSVRLDLPAINAKTLGTSGGDLLQLGFWLPPGVTTTGLYIAEAQVEACSPNASAATDGTGGSPTSYEHRGFQVEFSRVQRHFQQLTGPIVAGYQTGVQAIYTDYLWPVPMRAGPAVGISGSQTYANASGYILSGTVSNTGLRLAITSGGTGYCYGYGGLITADARL